MKNMQFLENINNQLPNPIPMPIAESPLFLSNEFRDRIIAAGEHVMNFILRPDFKQITEKSIPDKWRVANENDHPHIVTMDFAIAKDENGHYTPKLIELPGFPSLHGLEIDLGESYRSTYDIPENWTIYFNSLDKESYLKLLKETIIGSHQSDEVILMDVHQGEKSETSAFSYFIDTSLILLKILYNTSKYFKVLHSYFIDTS